MTSKHVLIDIVLFFKKSFCIFASHKNFMLWKVREAKEKYPHGGNLMPRYAVKVTEEYVELDTNY